jgi:hypothetical protein
MKRLDLFKQMSFGSQIAEDEVNALAGYFVETNQWQKIANGEIDIIRGEKGAGKSAIYALPELTIFLIMGRSWNAPAYFLCQWA